MKTNQITRTILNIRHSANQQASRSPAQDDRISVARAATAELVLIRGLPGSGKSTMVSVLTMIGYKHFEADMFFEFDGTYQYDATRIRDAHAWCQRMTRQALGRFENVVVSNTFTHLRELEPYRAMTKGVIRVIETKGRWENVH
jgi:ABC-type molybdenum transport system ATPase subunit/photorepair protein PhrA